MSSVKDYMWNTLCMPDLHPELKGMAYKLEHWPDFGQVSYKHNFIDLCALLSTQYVSYQQLKSFSGCSDEIISHLLNTLKTSNLLSTKPAPNDKEPHAHHFSLASYKAKLMSYLRSAYGRNEQRSAELARGA